MIDLVSTKSDTSPDSWSSPSSLTGSQNIVITSYILEYTCMTL